MCPCVLFHVSPKNKEKAKNSMGSSGKMRGGKHNRKDPDPRILDRRGIECAPKILDGVLLTLKLTYN
jgi:hypothetical protein